MAAISVGDLTPKVRKTKMGRKTRDANLRYCSVCVIQALYASPPLKPSIVGSDPNYRITGKHYLPKGVGSDPGLPGLVYSGTVPIR